MSQANVDLGVFQETKVTNEIYTKELGGYRVVATNSPSAHSSSVAVFYCEEDHFNLEAIFLHGPNIVRSYLASGGKWWYVVGGYLALDDYFTIEDVVAAIIQRPRRAALMVAGDFNSNLAAPEGNSRDEEIAAGKAWRT